MDGHRKRKSNPTQSQILAATEEDFRFVISAKVIVLEFLIKQLVTIQCARNWRRISPRDLEQLKNEFRKPFLKGEDRLSSLILSETDKIFAEIQRAFGHK